MEAVVLRMWEADVETDVAGQPVKKRTFKKFSYRGTDLDALLDISTEELVKLFPARPRRRLAAVCFKGKGHEIPQDMDPQIAAIIVYCWAK
ncbi:40S ribosomal protein S15-3 [Striga hermonthica]|uniref:40S ribosomal protein S15-3 n=1 Tax=Striga hermonthica TaxID=68872 RepID=A0A9N7R8B1_STRHE|nr:40S ribosomal protein S15-3 [Striga hermonthica]